MKGEAVRYDDKADDALYRRSNCLEARMVQSSYVSLCVKIHIYRQPVGSLQDGCNMSIQGFTFNHPACLGRSQEVLLVDV